MKQEITLRYYDFDESRSESSNSLNTTGYQFDGKNLLTYFKQKTGRKLVTDEAIGKFRDEHSGPFSVCSRSQINLRVCEIEAEEEEGPSTDYNKILSQKLAKEAAKRAAIMSPLNKTTKEHKKTEMDVTESIETNISYNKIKNEVDNAEQNPNFISKFINRLSVTTNNMNGNNTYETDEHENLVSGINLSFSTQHSEDSEEELHNHTEKSLEFKSLLDESNGFDFLNNW